MKVIGYITAFIIAWGGSTLWSAFALCKMWQWFIVSEFGVPPLKMATAIGVSMVVTYLTHQMSNNDKPLAQQFPLLCAMAFLKPTFLLLFGWIITLFM